MVFTSREQVGQEIRLSQTFTFIKLQAGYPGSARFTLYDLYCDYSIEVCFYLG